MLQPTDVQTQSADAHGLGANQSVPFRDVYEREFAVVMRVLRRLGVAERQLEDAAQEVFAVVLRRRTDFDVERPARPWLCGIATRVAADFRKRASNVHELPYGEPPPQLVRSHEEALDARQLLLLALDKLTETERTAIVLVALEGQSVVDVARALDIPSGTLYARIHEARKKLATALAQLTEVQQ